MTDLGSILPLWRQLESVGADYVLATVVAVEGSSYRKPGARMLLAQDGRRAGTISGGCLEAEVARRAWWLTSSGPALERYSTQEEDGDRPYGSGCGGVVYLLLERRATAAPLMGILSDAFLARTSLAIAIVLEGPHVGERAISKVPESPADAAEANNCTGEIGSALGRLADLAIQCRSSMTQTILVNGAETRVFIDYRPARPGLWIFSAGDDARPLVRITQELGWFVAVADGRSHLATRERFPSADEVHVLPITKLPQAGCTALTLRPTDAAVVMTHSFEQDSHALASLLALEPRPAYIGVLGPQRRTRELLAEAARLLGLPSTAERVEAWLEQLHAPTGLDLGGETPAAVALSILSEIQQTLAHGSAKPLHQVRGLKPVLAPCEI